MPYESRRSTPLQRDVMESQLGYDDGGRYALLAVNGYSIHEGFDDFGTVFSVIDTDTGAEVEISPVIGTRQVRAERPRWIGKVMHLNGKEDVYAA